MALKVLAKVDEIGQVRLTSQDVVRHPLVQKIVRAYDEYENRRQPGSGRNNGRNNKK